MATIVGEQSECITDLSSPSYVVDGEFFVESPATARRGARSRNVLPGPVVMVEEFQMSQSDTGVLYDIHSKTGDGFETSVLCDSDSKSGAEGSKTAVLGELASTSGAKETQDSVFGEILSQVKREKCKTGVLHDIYSNRAQQCERGGNGSQSSIFGEILTKVRTQKSKTGVLKTDKQSETQVFHASKSGEEESEIQSQSQFDLPATDSQISCQTAFEDKTVSSSDAYSKSHTSVKSKNGSIASTGLTELNERSKSNAYSKSHTSVKPKDGSIASTGLTELNRKGPKSDAQETPTKSSLRETITELTGQRSKSATHETHTKSSLRETITELSGQRSKSDTHETHTKSSLRETITELSGQRSKSDTQQNPSKHCMQSDSSDSDPGNNIHVTYSSDSAKQRTADILCDILAGGKQYTQVEVHVADVKNSDAVSDYKRRVFSQGHKQRPANILLLLSHWDSFEKKCIDDGPISVQDPVDNNMFTQPQDAAGSQSASKTLPSSSNQNQDLQRLDRAPANQAANQVNGNVIEDRKNLKHLPIEEVIERVKSIVHDLDKFVEFNRSEVMQLQKSLGDFYWDYSSHRKQIGDAIAEAGYAAITVRILKGLNTIGIFKNDDVWFPTYYTYNTTWNYSDCSELLAKNLAEADAVRLLTLNCGHKPYLSAVHSKNVYYVIKASMSILHNIARNPTAKAYFKENKTSEIIMPFISMSDDMLKVLAMLTLAYIVEEEDNTKLIDETGTIKNIVLWIEKALDNSKRRFKGFTPMELTQGLDKLAVNDGNKSRIIEEGAISLFMKMLLHDDPREHVVTARCIWTLSFDKGVRQELIDHEGLVSTLEKLSATSDKEVHKNASGALWILKGEIDPTNDRPKSAAKTKNHIFISYSWSDQQQAKEILNKLKAEGYNVWIDIEQMGGSTLEAMAGAIENSAVVLVCMSEKYKQSPNCRTEAEYTFQLRKDYIPLMMQKKYRPDGWLGLILGAKLFFDFSGKYPFEKSMSGLLKELRGRGQRGPMSAAPSVEEVDGPVEMCTTVDTLKGNPHRNIHPYTGVTVPAHAQMSREDVQKWLVANQLETCLTLFNQFDGRLMWQLKEMKQEAPDYFYQCLEKRLNLGLIDMLKLAAALDQMH